jgi:nucleoside-diphosphate-sugar epimerase
VSRVLVTGGSGFIGRRVLPMLVGAGHEVHASTSRQGAGEKDEIRWHRADLLDPSAAAELIAAARPTHLLHLAWYTEHGRFWEAPENLPWVEASLRLWRAFAASEGAERFVGVGSCAEYEWVEPILSEETTPLRPASLYGACKDATRRALEAASERAGISFAWGRVFFIYGPEEASGRLVPSVAEALAAGRPARSSDGEQIRDFMHVDDAARALAALLGSEVSGAVNLGSGEGVRVREVVETLGRLAGTPELIELGAVPRPDGDPAELVADARRLREQVGWAPEIDLERGLASTMQRARSATSSRPSRSTATGA